MKKCEECGRAIESLNGRYCSEECRKAAEIEQRFSTAKERRYNRASTLRRKRQYDREIKGCIDYLSGLEKRYGALPNGRIKRMIRDWSKGDEADIEY